MTGTYNHSDSYKCDFGFSKNDYYHLIKTMERYYNGKYTLIPLKRGGGGIEFINNDKESSAGSSMECNSSSDSGYRAICFNVDCWGDTGKTGNWEWIKQDFDIETWKDDKKFKIINPNTKFRFYLKSFRCNDPFTRDELDMFNFILERYGISTMKTKRVKAKDLTDDRF